MQKSFLDFSITGILPPLISGYIKNDVSLSEFYSYRPELGSFENAIEQKQKEKVNRELLVNSLSDQYKNIFQNDIVLNLKVKSNIDLLKNENTFTVTTGHQLNLFTGPLYFLYKIISTINLSEKLKEHYPKFNFIPVYWMASEDHDFEEINHIHLFGKKITWNQQQRGASGRISTESLKNILEELKLVSGSSETANEIIHLFELSYLKNKSLAEAHRQLVNQLFSEYGLVIVDGDDKKLKQEFIEIMTDDLKNNSAFNLIDETVKKLSVKFKTQVNPREINLFYLTEGMRERIIRDGSKFKVQNSKLIFSENEIINEIKNHPENFSPNVVLRPLYQEKILPNLAYIGGPGEISYWLEYKAMFDFFKINFPVLMLRNSVLWIDETAVSKLNKLKMTAADLFQDEDNLIRKIITANAQREISLDQEIKNIENIFERIKNKSDQSDQSLQISIEGEKQKIINSFKNIESKLMRAEKKKQETNINQLKKLREKIFPENIFQERYDNMISYYLKHGKLFIKTLKENFDPFDSRLLVLSENSLE